jgi:hypothetical protein
MNARRSPPAAGKMNVGRKKRREAWGLGWESVIFFSTLALSLFRFQGSGIGRRQEKARRLDCVTGLSAMAKIWR